jgi:16S rRNA C967 or C1407 C5-methylase (RsmB/RsmF family)/NOL1/NOP2/fmu family ribosome biogenesis protein
MLPKEFLDTLIGLPGYDREAFQKVHENGEQVVSIRINPARLSVNGQRTIPNELNYLAEEIMPVPWSRYGYYLSSRPSFTFDPFFHAGVYYVQEASSMFLEQVFAKIFGKQSPLRILDLSAAPGGKSTHIQSLVSKDSLLVSNEVIRNRALVLRDNVIKWGSSNIVVTNNDPSVFKNLAGYFDMIVADAPCSGSGLFRKDPHAINEWSLNNVALCSQRQQRILADVLPALKEGGYLVYSTCSYSLEEDEEIITWLQSEFEMETVRIPLPEDWGIVESSGKGWCYRFYPDKLKGEGFFISVLQKKASGKISGPRPSRIEKATGNEKKYLASWLDAEGMELFHEKGFYYMLPAGLMSDYSILRTVLNIQYPGTGLGQLIKDKLVPDHSLALSPRLKPSVPSFELSREDAIKYLQRQEFESQPTVKGWQTVNYMGRKLGWINALQNRINNYYPKELRILKQQQG